MTPSNLNLTLLFKPFWWEGSNDKVIYAGWTFQVCSTPVPWFSFCNGFTTRHFHIFLIMKLLLIISCKKWTKNPLIDDTQRFFKNWPLIMSPSHHLMAANVVFVVKFQFLLYFLAHVGTKNHALALFYGVLNSLCYLGCFFLLRKPILLFCVVGIDQFSSLQHQETTPRL